MIPVSDGRAGDPGEYAGPASPDEWVSQRLGHPRSTHLTFGWCGHCPGHDVVEEVQAWRLLAQRAQLVAWAAHDGDKWHDLVFASPGDAAVVASRYYTDPAGEPLGLGDGVTRLPLYAFPPIPGPPS